MDSDSNKIKVWNRIVEIALYGGYICDSTYLHGYVNYDTKHLSRMLITHLVCKALNIHRFPGYEETYGDDFISLSRRTFSNLKSKDFDDAYNEVLRIYQFTQEYLSKIYDSDKKVVLYRNLNPIECCEVYEKLKKGYKNIMFRSNILCSYTSDDKIYNHKPIVVKRYVDIKDIFIHYKCIQHNEDLLCPFECDGFENESEVLVINSNPFGIVEYPRESFEVREDVLNNSEIYFEYERDCDNGVTYPGSLPPVAKNKPCDNWLVKTAIFISSIKKL